MRTASVQTALLLFTVLLDNKGATQLRSFDFFITPAVVERKVAAGSKLELELSVNNRDSAPLVLHLGRADLAMTLEGDVRAVQNGNPDFSCKSWLNFPDSVLRIPGGGRSIIPVVIRVPFGIRGGRYAVLTAQTELQSAQADAITLMGQTGTIFLLQPVTRGKVSAQIREVTLARQSTQALHFMVRVLNDGELHFRAKGHILIKNQQDRIIDRVPLQMGTGTVLPKHERIFSGEWKNKRKMAAGAYRAVITVQVPGLARVLQEVRDFTL